MQKQLKNLALLYKAKHFKMTNPDAKSKRELLLMLKNKIIGAFNSSAKILGDYFDITTMYSLEEAECLISADRFADWYKFQPNLFDNMKIMTTRDGEFFVPKDYDEVLKQIYGNYMKIPPLETRLNEMLSHYKYLKDNCPL